MKPADLLAVIVAAAADPAARALLEAQARRAEDAGFGLVVEGEGT